MTLPTPQERYIGKRKPEPFTVLEVREAEKRIRVKYDGAVRQTWLHFDTWASLKAKLIVETLAPEMTLPAITLPMPGRVQDITEIVRVAVATAMAEHERRYHGAKQLTLVPSVAT